jgi:hypothetical protein
LIKNLTIATAGFQVPTFLVLKKFGEGIVVPQ